MEPSAPTQPVILSDVPGSPTDERSSGLIALPKEILAYVASNFLSPRDVVGLSSTSRTWYDFGSSNDIWLGLVTRDYKYDFEASKPLPGRYKEFYQSLAEYNNLFSLEDEDASTPSNNFDFVVRVVLVGDQSVGKTSLISRFAANQFHQKTQPTIQGNLVVRSVRARYKQRVTLSGKMQIWDSRSRERYRYLEQTFYRNKTIIALVFDLTNRDSFLGLDAWIKDMDRALDDKQVANVFLVLIGLKADLVASRAVSLAEAQQKARQMNAPYIETSAKTGRNVQKAFFLPASMALSQKPELILLRDLDSIPEGDEDDGSGRSARSSSSSASAPADLIHHNQVHNTHNTNNNQHHQQPQAAAPAGQQGAPPLRRGSSRNLLSSVVSSFKSLLKKEKSNPKLL